jgi:hypothetical protein
MSALIRKLVQVASPADRLHHHLRRRPVERASDAGYLILIPLGARS